MQLTAQMLAIVLHERNRRRRRRAALLLRLRGLLRERNYVSSSSLLQDQSDAPWYVMHAARDRATFLAMVSVPPETFDVLLVYFDKHYIVKSGSGRCGRPPQIPHKHTVLVMLLHFYTNTVDQKTLADLFAISPGTVSRVLRHAEAALAASLWEIPAAGIYRPSIETQRIWAAATHTREPLVSGVFGFVDGKNLRVQQPTEADLQNAHYNGTKTCVVWLICVSSVNVVVANAVVCI